MSVLTVIATILYVIVALTSIGNFIRLFVEGKQLKAQGKTPLIGRTSLTIILVAIAEVVAILVIMGVLARIGIPGSLISVIIVFVFTYYARQIIAYLVTWGLWSLLVRKDKKKAMEKIQQEMKNGTSQQG